MYVPDVLLFVAIDPPDEFEKEVTKDLAVFTADIVTLPVDAASPLCTDLIKEDWAGNTDSDILG